MSGKLVTLKGFNPQTKEEVYGGPPGGSMADSMRDHAQQKYHGDTAKGYDTKRVSQMKWHREEAIIREYLSDLHPASLILDVPVGTGRFIPLYLEHGLTAVGLDVSDDMLTEARKKAGTSEAISLQKGSVLDLPFGDRSFDTSLMIRMTRWLSPEDCVTALKELQRVTKHRIIFTARIANHVHARPYTLIYSALENWHICRDEAADGPDYRVIELRPE